MTHVLLVPHPSGPGDCPCQVVRHGIGIGLVASHYDISIRVLDASPGEVVGIERFVAREAVTPVVE